MTLPSNTRWSGRSLIMALATLCLLFSASRADAAAKRPGKHIARAAAGTTFTQPATYEFGPAGSSVVSGDTLDSGQAYAVARGRGWIRQSSLTSIGRVALDLSDNTRARSTSQKRVDSFIHMQFPSGSRGSGSTIAGAWELAVPAGTYAVSVTVGDVAYYDSKNVINVENTKVVNKFIGSRGTPLTTATTTVLVIDGKLTIDATGGSNTKLVAVTVQAKSTPAPPVIPAPILTAPPESATSILIALPVAPVVTPTTPEPPATPTPPTPTTTTPAPPAPPPPTTTTPAPPPTTTTPAPPPPTTTTPAPPPPTTTTPAPPPPPPAPATVGDDFYGVNTQYVFGDGDALVAARLAPAAAGGMRIVRHDAGWKFLEPNAPAGGVHNYRWSSFDTIVRQAAAKGLEWQPVIMQAPAWAAASPGAPNSAPSASHVSDYVALAQALASRYGTSGTFWTSNPSVTKVPVKTYEIWNEENATYWWGTLTDAPEDYADLFAATRTAIKAVDPNATVLVGGLAPTYKGALFSTQFVQRMLAHRPDLKGHIDGFGFHPYNTTAVTVEGMVKAFREALDTYDSPSTPIAITETGWSSYDTPEATRALQMGTLAKELAHSDCKISEFLPHTLTSRQNDAAQKEQWYGMFDPATGAAKASGQAYIDAIRLMRGQAGVAAPSGTLKICY
jgi:hypothetical protein